MIMLGTHGMLLKFSGSSEDLEDALSCQHRNLSYAQKILADCPAVSLDLCIFI